MVKAQLQYYYTFKVVSPESQPLKVEAHKWEELSGDHSGTIYTVFPDSNTWLGKCSCPAYRTCKHQKCVEEALRDGKAQEFWKWRWDDTNGWQELTDIRPIEEFAP